MNGYPKKERDLALALAWRYLGQASVILAAAQRQNQHFDLGLDLLPIERAVAITIAVVHQKLGAVPKEQAK